MLSDKGWAEMTKIQLVLTLLLATSTVLQAQTKIQSTHCPLGCPSISKENTLVIHHIFTLSNNPKTKFSDWVAYEVNPTNFGVTTGRNFTSDPLLHPNDTLEKNDYKGANSSSLKSDRGHQAPLASFAGNQYWYETNYLSNITPQHKKLNQGAWKFLEMAVREASTYKNPLYVITGPTYTGEIRQMPKADESHDVPDGYFKIVYDKKGNASFFHMSQTDNHDGLYCSKTTTLADITKNTNSIFPTFNSSKKLLNLLGCVGG